MSKAAHKEAERLLKRFKTKLETVWKEQDVMKAGSMSECNLFWFENENRPSSEKVRDEILKMVDSESIELKLIFNNLTFGGFRCPQKRWFLGDETSTDLLPRQPSNVPAFFASCLTDDLRQEQTAFASLSPKPLTVTNRRLMYARNNMLSGTVLGKDTGDRPYYFHSLENSTDTPTKDFVFRGSKINLVEGQLTSDKQVVIYVNDKKMNKYILQWALKENGDKVLILYDSFFMAAGDIKENKTGILLKCRELRGTYGTGKFAISPDFRLLIRESAINTVPRSSVKLGKLSHLKTIVEMIEEEERPDRNNDNKDRTDRQIQLISIMCADSRIFLKMTENYNRDPAPGYALTSFEKMIHNYHEAQNRLGSIESNCNHNVAQCENIHKILTLSHEWIDEQNNEEDDYLDGMIYIVTKMLEIYYTGITCNREEEVAVCSNQRIEQTKAVLPPNGIKYFPPGCYILPCSREQWGFVFDCLIPEDFRNMNYENMDNVMEYIMRQRPDIMLFSPSKFDFPLQFIRRFAQWYNEEHFNKFQIKEISLTTEIASLNIH
ncbi:hypothetical protein GCK72_024851 [Caenorhabditis remanei]|uniref:Uncharacterized protein n=1 Tax=Caenorhabditis remanei TaxID=31234 RepID=A0A6A5G176_CAERE|nr:hypothetical protein GCK72_024851 [Caenorhabditis remanei]KAF1748384.1 hypothetical protein GCK72_024851 [Caenorhabditis remanei]